MSRRIRLRIKGVMATTDPVEVRGKILQLTEDQLKQLADSAVGKPIKYEHRGRPTGEIEKAWYDNGKLWVEAAIYEPENREEEEIVRKIESGELHAFSPGLAFKPVPTKVVLHGTVEVVGKNKNDKPIVQFFIPAEEITSKIGSMGNVKKFTFTDTWLHDGSEKAKKKVEDEFTENDT
jgi:hypothetical protein